MRKVNSSYFVFGSGKNMFPPLRYYFQSISPCCECTKSRNATLKREISSATWAARAELSWAVYSKGQARVLLSQEACHGMWQELGLQGLAPHSTSRRVPGQSWLKPSGVCSSWRRGAKHKRAFLMSVVQRVQLASQGERAALTCNTSLARAMPWFVMCGKASPANTLGVAARYQTLAMDFRSKADLCSTLGQEGKLLAEPAVAGMQPCLWLNGNVRMGWEEVLVA